MLAHAALQSGFTPLTIDLFEDRDTQQFALAHTKAASLSVADIAGRVENFIRMYGIRYAVYGSGLESFPETIDYLNKKLIVLGNSSVTFALCQSKAFFSILERLDIVYPSVSFSAPENPKIPWLEKDWQRQGGSGVRFYRREQASLPHKAYWQHFIDGSSHSVLFLSNGKSAKIAGFNTQWHSKPEDKEACLAFGGVINHLECSRQIKLKLADITIKLSLEFNLIGLNALDFMIFEDEILVLEINARPSFSMQLYSAPLFYWHTQACLGSLPDELPIENEIKGIQLVYAQNDVHIGEHFEWPPEIRDIPQPGSLIRTGQPICSIMARAKTPPLVVLKLQLLQQFIVNQLQQK